MTRNGSISSRRHPGHDYSSPGTYYLGLPLRDESAPLVRTYSGRRYPTTEGRAVLREVGESLHRQGRHLRLDALDLQPWMAVLVVTVVSRPTLLRRLLMVMSEALYRRRMALIPLFVGHVKMNSARRINAMHGKGGGSYWREGYRDRVIFDEVEVEAVVERVGRDFGDILFRDDAGEEREVAGMVLGCAYVVDIPTGEVSWSDADSCIRISQDELVRRPRWTVVGAVPGRASPRILAVEGWL
jgi:hypothetical protein